MKTYPIKIYASKISYMRPCTEGLNPEIEIILECSDIEDMFDCIASDCLQQELFKYLKENFDQETLKEALCI